MLEYIAGVTLAAAVLAVGSHQQQKKRNEARLVRPDRFERELEKFTEEAGALTCSFCEGTCEPAKVKVIFRTAQGDRGIVCDKTPCLLSYMRTGAAAESSPAAGAA